MAQYENGLQNNGLKFVNWAQYVASKSNCVILEPRMVSATPGLTASVKQTKFW